MYFSCCFFKLLCSEVSKRYRSSLLILFSVALLSACSSSQSVQKSLSETPENNVRSGSEEQTILEQHSPTIEPVNKRHVAEATTSVEQNVQQAESQQDDDTQQPKKRKDAFGIDTMRRGLATGVFETAKWIDSFFADPDYPNENVDVELEVRQFFIKSESKDVDMKTRASGRVRLPNAERSVSLTFDGNDEQESEAGNSNISDSVRNADDQPSLGLEYLKEKSPGYNQRVKLGYRFGEDSFYLGGRLRKAVTVGDNWLFRTSQRVRWYHQFGWENRTIIDFESLLPQNRFFQQRLLLSWREDERDEPGAQITMQSAYIYPLSDTSAWRLIWSSNYHTQPKPRWVSTQLAWGYRMQLPKEWIYVEVRPFVEWEELFHWQEKFGLHLSFDLIIQK